MAKRGWLGLMTGLTVIALGCERADPNAEGVPGEAEVLPATVSARDFGEYELHFNTLTTDRLDAGIAAEHDIVRSKNSALLNISVQRKQEIGTPTSVEAIVTASARNLTGQIRNIPIQMIREGDAIYYIGQTRIVNAETLIFTVEAIPESDERLLTVSFQRQFFVDE